nr:Os02g0704131 [Ipomoea batatas]
MMASAFVPAREGQRRGGSGGGNRGGCSYKWQSEYVLVFLGDVSRIDHPKIEIPGGKRLPENHAGFEINREFLHRRVNQIHAFHGVFNGHYIRSHHDYGVPLIFFPGVYGVDDIEPRHLEPPHFRLVFSVPWNHSDSRDFPGRSPDRRAAVEEIQRVHSDLDVGKNGVVFGDGEIVHKRRGRHGENRDVGLFDAVGVYSEER